MNESLTPEEFGSESLTQEKAHNQTSLWQSLLHHGVVSGEQPAKAEIQSPWFVKLLLAISGWFAALFFLGFLALAMEFIFDSDHGAFIVGAILTLGAYALFTLNKNEFIEHLSLAVSFSGQILIVYGFIQHFDDDTCWLLATILQFCLMAIMPNDIHRFCSAFFAACCFIVTLAIFQLPFIATSIILLLACWLFLHEFERKGQTNNPLLNSLFSVVLLHKRPIAYGLLLAPLVQTCFMSFQYAWYGLIESELLSTESLTAPWMGDVLLALVSLYVVWQIVNRYPELSVKVRYSVLVISLLVSALSFEAHGINIGFLIMVLGFSASNRLLLGLGVIALVTFISAYYYFLDFSLLDKSYTLMLIGVFLLAVRWAMLKFVTKQREQADA
ncbi:DUF4401 domain-containing protein [Shewanella electrodiphila]|uniref:DUF4401 domain-containing protein n=1 Tax=Shewanella electrodiphila TaxID=934143 RepID=A0ABT0KS29_9GAMM|nr:DUF4401 domain-containing protein [Shewanella electrodiphila]MCL1046464.1 DUF4401 domain-containing protein [Shewanella electrodiphila]